MKLFRFQSLLLVLLFLLIRFPELCIKGASAGLVLWYQTVVPTLLPGMIVSSLIVQTNAAHYLTAVVHPILKRIVHTSTKEGSYCVLIGLLCGYPTGAKTCADYIRLGCFDRSFGNHLMSFINYPSPAFLSGYIAAKYIGSSLLPLILLSIWLPGIILSNCSYFIFKLSAKKNLTSQASAPKRNCFSSHNSVIQTDSFEKCLDKALSQSIPVIVTIGCYMMLFSLLAGLVQALPCSVEALRYISTGILEMTTGIHEVSLSSLSIRAQGAWMCGLAGFGGLSVFMQTLSVVKDCNLSFFSYLFWKILHGILSALLFFFLF